MDWRRSGGNISDTIDQSEPITIQKRESFLVYIFMFQYYIIIKLIASPLLFSMFAVTASKWVSEIDSIWKFQRYQLVIDFANRLPIPEPFSLFYYIYIMARYGISFLDKSINSITSKVSTRFVDKSNLTQNFTFDSFTCCAQMKKKPTSSKCNENNNKISPQDCLYWKQLAAEYFDTEMNKLMEANIQHKEWESIQEISEEIEYEKRVLREIKGKIGELEKNLQFRELTDDNRKCKGENYLSHQSPYPGTQIGRYPLAQKYRCWHIAHFSYEPVCYTKPDEEFPPNLKMFLDRDILGIKMKTRRNEGLLVKIPQYKWNDKDVDEKGVVIDRRSWHYSLETNRPVDENRSYPPYKLAENFLPLNPIGRTGVCGKGALPRWGPNHYCIIIIMQNQTNPTNGTVKVLLECQKNKKQLIEVGYMLVMHILAPGLIE